MNGWNWGQTTCSGTTHLALAPLSSTLGSAGQGRTPLHIAADAGKLEACRLLKQAMIRHDQPPVGPNAPVDLSGLTPVAWNARAEAALRRRERRNEQEVRDRSELKKLL